MIFGVLKHNRLARITVIITTFTVVVCIGVSYMIIKLSDKIQETKISIKQNSLNATKIEELFAEYQKVELNPLESKIKSTKQPLKKDNLVDLIELMEKLSLQNKILPQVQIEGGNDLSRLAGSLIYNISFTATKEKMQHYVHDLENLPYVSQIYELHSILNMNSKEIIGLKDENAVIAKIENQEINSNKTYTLRLKIEIE